MTLTELIVCIGLFMPAIGALQSAQHATARFLVYALVIPVGLAAGILGTWTWWSVFSAIGNRERTHSAIRQKRALLPLFLALVSWIFFGAFLGGWITSAAMRLVG